MTVDTDPMYLYLLQSDTILRLTKIVMTKITGYKIIFRGPFFQNLESSIPRNLRHYLHYLIAS